MSVVTKCVVIDKHEEHSQQVCGASLNMGPDSR